MKSGKRTCRALSWAGRAYVLLAVCCAMIELTGAVAAAQTAATPKTPPAVGTIKNISGTTITLTTDAGSELQITLSGDVKYLRVSPESKSLKDAVPIQLSDLQQGDRILVRGTLGNTAASFVASTVIAMKKEDISAKQTHEREDWQRRGDRRVGEEYGSLGWHNNDWYDDGSWNERRGGTHFQNDGT